MTGDVSLLPEIIKHADYFLDVNKPRDFNPFGLNVLIIMENEFESMAAALSENGVHNASDLTIFEFYSRIKYFEAKSTKK